MRMLGARIRQLREEKGLTQEELGFRAGRDPTAIQKYEAGITEPLSGALLDITRALDAKPDDVFSGDVWERVKARVAARQEPGGD